MEFDKFILVSAYFPHAGPDLKRLEYRIGEWDIDFEEYIKQLEAEYKKPVVLAGDFNVAHEEIDIENPDKKDETPCYTPIERQSFSELLERGFIDTFRHLNPKKVQYTARQWPLRGNWRLDYFLISKNYQEEHGIRLVDSSIHENSIFGSDHCPISLHLQLSEEEDEPIVADYEEKVTLLLDWETVFDYRKLQILTQVVITNLRESKQASKLTEITES